MRLEKRYPPLPRDQMLLNIDAIIKCFICFSVAGISHHLLNHYQKKQLTGYETKCSQIPKFNNLHEFKRLHMGRAEMALPAKAHARRAGCICRQGEAAAAELLRSAAEPSRANARLKCALLPATPSTNGP